MVERWVSNKKLTKRLAEGYRHVIRNGEAVASNKTDREGNPVAFLMEFRKEQEQPKRKPSTRRKKRTP